MRTLKGEDDLWIENAPAVLRSNRRTLPASVGTLPYAGEGDLLRFQPCGSGLQEGPCPVAVMPGYDVIAVSTGAISDLEAAFDDFKDAVEDAAAAIGPLLASIIQGILSFFPGIGTALAVAMAAGIALARGRPIEEVVLTAAASAMPGGPAASVAYTNAVVIGTKIAKGENLLKIALDTARTNLGKLPGGTYLQTGFDATLDIARGKDPGDVALAIVRKNLPGGDIAKRAFDLTVQIARGQNVEEAIIRDVRALLPPGMAQTAFDASVATARGNPPTMLAIRAARDAALANGGQEALDSFDVFTPISMGAPVDQLALKALRDKVMPLVNQTKDEALAAFDQSVTVATAIGLQNSGFGEAATFMPWKPSVWGTDTGDYDPHQHRLAELAFDFANAAARAITLQEPALKTAFRDFLTELAGLDPRQWDYYPSIVSHLQANRSQYEHDLQDIPPDLLKDRYEALLKPTFRDLPEIHEAIVRAALGSVPYTIKPPFSDRKSKARGQDDINASFARAIPGADARRSRISNAISLYRQVDTHLLNGRTVAQVFEWAHGPAPWGASGLYGGEAAQLTYDQIYARVHALAKLGKMKDDYPEWHLLDDPTGKVAATWASEAEFLAAPFLSTAADYRKRAKLETELANRVLEGTADGKGKALLDKAAADTKEAARLDMITFTKIAADPSRLVRILTPAEVAAQKAKDAADLATYTMVQRANIIAKQGAAYAKADADLAAKATADATVALNATILQAKRVDLDKWVQFYLAKVRIG